MPPSDQEPRYQLVDSNGNVVGSLFGDGSGNVVIADETDTQTTFDADGITTPTLEAGQQTINQHSISLGKNTSQTITASTDTTIDWDFQNVDADLFTYNPDDTISIEVDGDYQVNITIGYNNVSSGERIFIKTFVNGNRQTNISKTVNGDFDEYSASRLLKGLSQGDTIRIDARSSNGAEIEGADDSTYASIQKEA